MELDQWQKDVKATKGNMCICSGRQGGKSTIISEDAGDFALENKNKNIMIIASVERQALLLFEKVLAYIYKENKAMIKIGKERPTKHKLCLKNGTVIHCLPTGDSGYGIRGFTIDRLYADEAAFIPDEVWTAVTPMLVTTGGDIVLLSTPNGSEGYFYRCFHDKKNFTTFHVNTQEVAEGRKEPQRSRMLEFLADEKERMTKLQYKQEYLAEFVGGIKRFISDNLIDMICTIKPKDKYLPIGDKFQGIDISRMGGDECPMVSVDRINRKRIKMFELEIPEPQRLTDTARLIIHKDKQLKHKKIYMDDGGLGVGVYDMLYEDPQTKRKVIGLNNASREIERTINRGKTKIRSKTLFGVDMSINLKILMEKGEIELWDDPRVRQSLRSMQIEYGEGDVKIYGNYSHIFEALKRAAHCMKDKSLNIYVY